MFLFSKGVSALYLVFHWSFIRFSSSVVASTFWKLLKVWKMLWKPNHQPSVRLSGQANTWRKIKIYFFAQLVVFFYFALSILHPKTLQQKPIFVFDIQASGNNEINCIGMIAISNLTSRHRHLEDFLWTAATLSLTLWGVLLFSVFSWETFAAVEAK